MAKRNYHEGDWFAVPLGQGGYALGIIARTSQLGVLLGYFFGPRRTELPTLDDVTGLRPDAAVWITRFTDHGLRGRRRSGILWPILGRLADWDRSTWPLPVFARLDSRTGHAFRVYYGGDDDQLTVVVNDWTGKHRLIHEKVKHPQPSPRGETKR